MYNNFIPMQDGVYQTSRNGLLQLEQITIFLLASVMMLNTHTLALVVRYILIHLDIMIRQRSHSTVFDEVKYLIQRLVRERSCSTVFDEVKYLRQILVGSVYD